MFIVRERIWKLAKTLVHGPLATNSYDFLCDSNLPVHMDGSCNGLQHYAALGEKIANERLKTKYVNKHKHF